VHERISDYHPSQVASIKDRARSDLSQVATSETAEIDLLPTSLTAPVYPEQRGPEKVFAPGETAQIPVVFNTPKLCPKGALVEVVVSEAIRDSFTVKHCLVSRGEPVITVTNITSEPVLLKCTIPVATARFHGVERQEKLAQCLAASLPSSSSSDTQTLVALAEQVLVQCNKFDEDDINAVGEKTFYGHG